MAEVGEGDGDIVRRGSLRCPDCGRATEVRDGIWHAIDSAGRSGRTLAQLTNDVPLTSRLYEATWRARSLSLLSGRRFPISEELSELGQWTAPAPGQVAVDVACSEGLYARRLARSGAFVLAVDHSLPFLRAVQRRCAREGLVVAPVRAEAQHLPLLDGAADVTAMGGSLNEIGDRSGALGEMARVLRPGGRAFSMSLVAARRPAGRLLQAALRPTGITADSALGTVDAFAGAGLRTVRCRLDGIVLRLDLEPAVR